MTKTKIVSLEHNYNDSNQSMVRNITLCVVPNKVQKKSATSNDLDRLIFIQNGKMCITYNSGKTVTLTTGDVFIPKESINTITTLNCEDYCIFFRDLRKNLSDLPVFRLEDDFVNLSPPLRDKMIVYLDKMISEFQLQEMGYNIALDINFSQILLLVSKACDAMVTPSDNINFSRIKPAIIEMNNNYRQFMTLNEYAELCNMSISSFHHIFAKIMHTTPLQYLKNIKLRNSTFLLTESDYTVTEIAELLGFSSPAYFSNTFKQTYGVSPLDYRNLHK